ncbi:MAG: hypothetical protein K9N47_23870 [Prosthecobacter sp.]|uniref:hypothetical protein n=1 Tax=Prosthecobacter sp. TaxID=1965333 RepID=UPI0026346B6C|nr:hypothetical protein [Prosthecobacter sp.]MCF7789183.1 hypothetical protein [Prosthecobacter sp.]
MSEVLPLPVILARRVMTGVSVKELQGIAVSWIESGHDFPALHELAWDPVLSWRDADFLFDAVASTVGLSLPSRAEASEILVYYHIRRIAQGHCTPEGGLAGIMRDAYWPELSKKTSLVYVGDADGLEHFIGAYWGYDDLRDSPDVVGYDGLYGEEAVQAFDMHVRNLAAEWLLQHPAPNDLACLDGKPFAD